MMKTYLYKKHKSITRNLVFSLLLLLKTYNFTRKKTVFNTYFFTPQKCFILFYFIFTLKISFQVNFGVIFCFTLFFNSRPQVYFTTMHLFLEEILGLYSRDKKYLIKRFFI